MFYKEIERLCLKQNMFFFYEVMQSHKRELSVYRRRTSKKYFFAKQHV